MGVRFGRFVPEAAYIALEPFFQAFFTARGEPVPDNPEQRVELEQRIRQYQTDLKALQLRLEAPTGEVIPTGFIDIWDGAAELDDEFAREVMVHIPDYLDFFSDEE